MLAAVYLIFNEGYAATAGEALVRRELCAEAIRLGRLLVELMPGRPEPRGLLALMLLHHARRDARVDAEGRLVLLSDQDRTLWHAGEIEEGRALAAGSAPGRYGLQAAIAAEHVADATDWAHVAALYAARRARPEPGDRAQPRRRGGDGRGPRARARRDRRDRRPRRLPPAALRTRRPAAAAGARARTRAPPTSARSSWPPTRSSARSSSGGYATSSVERR